VSHGKPPLIHVTGDPVRGIAEHKGKLIPGFTATYGIDRLVAREKAIKKWR
jgi:hypothetical protein